MQAKSGAVMMMMINQRALLCIVRQLANHKGPEHAKGRYSVGRFHYSLFGGTVQPWNRTSMLPCTPGVLPIDWSFQGLGVPLHTHTAGSGPNIHVPAEPHGIGALYMPPSDSGPKTTSPPPTFLLYQAFTLQS